MTTKEIQLLVGRSQVLKYHSPVCENVKDALGICEFDVLSVSKSEMVYEFEVKISRSDFKADLKKKKHEYYSKGFEHRTRTPNYFSYVCPADLIKLGEIASSTGLYYAANGEITEIRKPKRLHDFIHDKNKLNAKICRITSERQFLGACRLTYENKAITERYANRETNQSEY